MAYSSFGLKWRLLIGEVVTESSLALMAGMVAVKVGVMVNVAVAVGVYVGVNVGVMVGSGVIVLVLVGMGVKVDVGVGVGAAKLLQPAKKMAAINIMIRVFDWVNFITFLNEKFLPLVLKNYTMNLAIFPT